MYNMSCYNLPKSSILFQASKVSQISISQILPPPPRFPRSSDGKVDSSYRLPNLSLDSNFASHFPVRDRPVQIQRDSNETSSPPCMQMGNQQGRHSSFV